MGETLRERESYGVLINWGMQRLGSKLDLKLQCVASTRSDDPRALDDLHVVMTREQAAVLANYLFEASGNTPPSPRRSWLRRWFG